MHRALVLPTLLLGGCCCCGWGGGGGSSSSGGLGDRFGDKLGEKAQEMAVEKIYEASTGHDLDIAAGGATLVAETDDGKITTYMDGKIPDGFAWPLPSDAKVTLATRLDPKDPATQGGPTWMVSYETAGDWKTVAAALTAEGVKQGYKVTSTSAAMKEALEAAAAQGMAMPTPAGEETGDMLAFESSDPNKSGGAMIDGSVPGKTTVVLTVR